MTEPEKRRQELCQRMQHLFGVKNCLPQALWRPTVLAYTNSLMQKLLHGLCDRFTIVRGLEGWKFQLDSCHCQLIDQDGALQASQSHY